VARARRIERFLSQPFFVAEAFTGTSGEYVPIAETVRGFQEILEGKHDDVPEGAFFLKGSIDQVVEARGEAKEEEQEGEEDEPEKDEAESEAEEGADEREAQEDAGGTDDSGEETDE